MNNPINRMRFIVACIVCLSSMFVNAVSAASIQLNIANNIYTQNGELVFKRTGVSTSAVLKGAKLKASEKRIPLGGRRLLGNSQFRNNDYVALGQSRNSGEMMVEIFDATGNRVGKLDIPQMKFPGLLNQSIVAIPTSFHAVGTVHELEFYSLQGELLNKVSVPNLLLMTSLPQPGGQLATVNKGTALNDRVVRVYSPNGGLLWNYSWVGQEYPDVKVTPDSSRIILLSRDEEYSNISILDRSNKLVGQYKIDGVSGLAVDNKSQLLAIAAVEGLFLINLTSGNIDWKKPGSIYALHGGVQFDKKTGRLYVLHGEVANSKENSLYMTRFELKDGKAKKVNLGMIGNSDPYFQVIDIVDDAQGAKHITFVREVRTINPDAWNKP